MPDILWAPLRVLILSIPPSRLLLIPSLGGSVWFATLTGLLMTWIARGMPRYPGQRNPDVASVALFLSQSISLKPRPASSQKLPPSNSNRSSSSVPPSQQLASLSPSPQCTSCATSPLSHSPIPLPVPMIVLLTHTRRPM